MTSEIDTSKPESPRRKRSLSVEDNQTSEGTHPHKKIALENDAESPVAFDMEHADDNNGDMEVQVNTIDRLHQEDAESFNRSRSLEKSPSPTRSQRSQSRSLSPHPRRLSPSPQNSSGEQNETGATAPEQTSTTASADLDQSSGTRSPPNQIQIRALVTTKEAGILIGMKGKNIQDMREASGAKMGISEQVQGVNERILNVNGPVDVVAKAFNLIARSIITATQNFALASPNPPRDLPSPSVVPITINILVPNNRIGAIIGKSGTKIKEIQETSNSRIIASEDTLPHSTDRCLSITGVPDAIHITIFHVAKTLLEVWHERTHTGIQYKPSNRLLPAVPSSASSYSSSSRHSHSSRSHGGSSSRSQSQNEQHQTMFIPSHIVGAVIGKGGTKIKEIRHTSKCDIRISDGKGDNGNDGKGGESERKVDIIGTPEACQKAIYLLHQRIEMEIKRCQDNGERR